MKHKIATTINIDEIRDIFKEDCEEDSKKFSEKKFQKFLDFLEIDLYDWVNGNLRYFYQQQKK
jgi:succinate dehydrogenase flavin-adding protein (antitoxin of CptAB toxin-antitoxin module)